MKPLSIRFVVLASITFILCTSFTGGKESAPSRKHSAVEFATFYYWYYANDTYDGYMTPSQAIAQLEDSLHLIVNTNSLGGTFVAAAYGDDIYPHDAWAVMNLYSH